LPTLHYIISSFKLHCTTQRALQPENSCSPSWLRFPFLSHSTSFSHLCQTCVAPRDQRPPKNHTPTPPFVTPPFTPFTLNPPISRCFLDAVHLLITSTAREKGGGVEKIWFICEDLAFMFAGIILIWSWEEESQRERELKGENSLI